MAVEAVVKCYQRLDVWHLGMVVAEEIYHATEAFPKHETYGLQSQLRRAAVSIPSDIAEGHARDSTRELSASRFDRDWIDSRSGDSGSAFRSSSVYAATGSQRHPASTGSAWKNARRPPTFPQSKALIVSCPQ